MLPLGEKNVAGLKDLKSAMNSCSQLVSQSVSQSSQSDWRTDFNASVQSVSQVNQIDVPDFNASVRQSVSQSSESDWRTRL